jgi:hypothetical protein
MYVAIIGMVLANVGAASTAFAVWRMARKIRLRLRAVNKAMSAIFEPVGPSGKAEIERQREALIARINNRHRPDQIGG